MDRGANHPKASRIAPTTPNDSRAFGVKLHMRLRATLNADRADAFGERLIGAKH